MAAARLYLYPRFERLWHWSQAALVLALLLTGLEIHGSLTLIGFEAAVAWHNRLVWALLVLIAFAVFWHVTTGEWRQYVPTAGRLGAMARFYAVGIFSGEPHPTEKTRLAKLNPLQRLTYLGLKVLIFPVQLGSGLAYLYSDELRAAGIDLPLRALALIHTAGAFALLAFVIAHVYLTTTGHTALSNIRAMITGWELAPKHGSAGVEVHGAARPNSGPNSGPDSAGHAEADREPAGSAAA
jgi:thiosulfate reductase cytochrome b subunit